MTELDLSGLKCPLPILKIRRAMQSLTVGEKLSVIATDEGIKRDLPDYCRQSGHKIVQEDQSENHLRYIIQKY